MNEPVLMIPSFRSGRETPWTGDTLHRKYEKYSLGNLIGESYDFSTVPGLESSTPDGISLSDLLGDNTAAPFIIKWVDADAPMSVHVHSQHDEYLIVTDISHDARIVAGLREHIEIESLAALLPEASPEDIFCFKAVKPGDVIHIPTGAPHSLAGVTCYQIQSPQNDSFRLYDWERANAHGQKRPLQSENALSCLSKQTAVCSVPQSDHLIHAPTFDVHRMHNLSDEKFPVSQPFSVLTCLVPGMITLETGKRLYLCAGQTVYIPGDSIAFTLSGEHFLSAVPHA